MKMLTNSKEKQSKLEIIYIENLVKDKKLNLLKVKEHKK